jgi:hypothetical protein
MRNNPVLTHTAAEADAFAVTTLRAKLINIFACPGDVFDEIAAAPHRASNWLAPTLLVCAAGIGAVFLSPAKPPADELTRTAVLTVILSTWIGTVWSALVLWTIGRLFLKVQFPFLKAVEVAALSGMILALGTVVTSLLALATGDPAARPALSLFVREFDPANRVHAALAALNLFHFWIAGVLAVGLSKLSGVSFKEAAFWTIGYWMVLRLAFFWI